MNNDSISGNFDKHQSLAYRPDIDGLRALAVLLVVGYHAFPGAVKGGFIGVDIFFVISGYLIGGIILTNLKANEFTYRNFYFRRILRIFPALILVFMGVLIAGYICLLPDELENLGLHVLAGGFFGENFLLWKSTGYFDTAAHAKPLLNLWSLGIEEQFYIFFPLLLLFCWKKGLRVFTILAILALMSLTDCIWLSKIDRTADFYSPLTRFWELFAGCMLKAAEMSSGYGAVREKINKIFSKIFYRDGTNSRIALGLFLAGLGIVGLGFALFRISQQSWYPGWLALFPVCVALCLIAAGPENPVSYYLLCNKAAVFVGKISYPLYLWHWPLLSFAWMINGHLDASTRLLRAELVLVAFLLACLTYWLVERPIRLKRCLGRASIPVLVGGMAVCCCAGVWVHYAQGLPERANMKASAAIWSLLSPATSRNEAGLKYPGIKSGEFKYCKYNDIGQKETVAIWEDSHANAAFSGIAKLGEQLANSGEEGFNTLCLAEVGADILKPESLKKFVNIVSQHPEIKKIFLITRGMLYITGVLNRVENIRAPGYPSGIGPEKFEKIYMDMINTLLHMGKEVIVVAENPELNHTVRSAIKRGVQGVTINHDRLKLLKKDILVWEKPYLEVLKKINKNLKVEVIYSNDAFCPGAECLVLDDNGLPLYYDENHLTALGSEFQAQRMIKPWFEKKRREEGEAKTLE